MGPDVFVARSTDPKTAGARLRKMTWIGALLGAPAACSPAPTVPVTPPADAGDGAAELDSVCKLVAGATAEVVVGHGQSDYLPLADLETVQVEAGPQGGHHIWIAIRMKNLLRSGSRTTVTAVAPDSGVSIAPYDVIFTFDPDEGGYCKLYGLRFQLDAAGVDYLPLLGKELDVTAIVVDRTGDSARGSRRVTLSDVVL
jgi:hypothetical protein